MFVWVNINEENVEQSARAEETAVSIFVLVLLLM